MSESDLFAYRGDAPGGLTDLQEDSFAHYAHLRDSEGTAEDRRYLGKLWENYRDLELADPDFLKRFPRECHQRIWEMHLAWVFTRWGWQLRPSPGGGAGPDMGIVCDGDKTMWVEAVAPSDGTGPDAVPRRKHVFGGELEHSLSLRYLSSIHEKRQQWVRWLAARLVSEEDGFLIAISEARLTWRRSDYRPDPPRIVKALHGLGEPTILVAIGDPGAKPRSAPTKMRCTIQKLNESRGEVPANLFVTGDAPEVSAVLLSSRMILNPPSEPGADFRLVHNPFANLPFPYGALGAGAEWGPVLARNPPFPEEDEGA